MKTNYHTHTTRCMHATGSDEDYVLSAIKGGYQELGFSDHTPWKYHTDYVADMRMLPEELPGYVESREAGEQSVIITFASAQTVTCIIESYAGNGKKSIAA